MNSRRKRGQPELEPSDEERICLVVAAVPRGRVVTYGQVAELAGLPRGARKVGRTLSRLPRGSRIPWHRVVNAAGRISLLEGSEAYLRQRRRLEAEGVEFHVGRLSLTRFRWRP